MKRLFKTITSYVLFFAIAISATFGFTGCKSSGNGGGGGSAKVMYTMNVLDDFRTLLLNGIVDAAAAEGITLDVMDECMTVDEQIAQIQKAVSEGYDAIICLPVDTNTALQLEVTAGDIPIIFVNSSPASDYLEKDKYMFVGSYERDAGTYQAEYVWETLGKPKSLNAIIFEGEQGHSATIGRTASVKEFFRDNGVDANFVFCDYATWSDVIAEEKFDIFMKTGQSFDAVFCNNDTMAVGVVKAMQKHGFSTADIPVCGVDATAAGCQSIVDGGMQFTVYQSASGQGEMAVKTARALATKGTADGIEGLTDDGTIVWVPFEKVDKNNVKDYMK